MVDRIPNNENRRNCALTTSAHKTEGKKRTKTMRFYPIVSTGKERDEETGHVCFCARYLDDLSQGNKCKGGISPYRKAW